MAGFGEMKNSKINKITPKIKCQTGGETIYEKSLKLQMSTIKIEELIRESLIAYQQGNLKSAKTLLNETIEADQKNSFALGLLATIEKALGNNERASQLFEQSIGIDQSNPDILHNYSGLLQENDPTKAVRMSNKALEISPRNSNYLERNGYLRWKIGDLENALKITIIAINLRPDIIDAQINLGGIYKDLGNLDQALTSTLKSLELKPDNPNAHMNLGGIYIELGNLDQALASTLKSLELKPDNPNALSNLLNVYGEGDLTILKTMTINAVNRNQDILNNLSFIEAISSLGKDCAKDIISTTASTN